MIFTVLKSNIIHRKILKTFEQYNIKLGIKNYQSMTEQTSNDKRETKDRKNCNGGYRTL